METKIETAKKDTFDITLALARVALTIGFIVMALEFFYDNAIGVAAMATIWTGWNVLWGVLLLERAIKNTVHLNRDISPTKEET
jgi:hypothetical protein